MPNAVVASVTISFFMSWVEAMLHGKNKLNPRTVRYSDFFSKARCPRRHPVRNATPSSVRFLLSLTRDRGKPRDRVVLGVPAQSLLRRLPPPGVLQSHAPSGRYAHSAHK